MPKLSRPVSARRLPRVLILTLSCVLLVSACAGPGRAGLARNRTVISTAELEQMRRSGVADLHEVVSRLRPRWLQTRTERSLALETLVLVYYLDTRLGGVEVLRGYPLTGVTSLRYLDSAQAMLLPGAGSAHIEGAIVIVTAPPR